MEKFKQWINRKCQQSDQTLSQDDKIGQSQFQNIKSKLYKGQSVQNAIKIFFKQIGIHSNQISEEYNSFKNEQFYNEFIQELSIQKWFKKIEKQENVETNEFRSQKLQELIIQLMFDKEKDSLKRIKQFLEQVYNLPQNRVKFYQIHLKKQPFYSKLIPKTITKQKFKKLLEQFDMEYQNINTILLNLKQKDKALFLDFKEQLNKYLKKKIIKVIKDLQDFQKVLSNYEAVIKPLKKLNNQIVSYNFYEDPICKSVMPMNKSNQINFNDYYNNYIETLYCFISNQIKKIKQVVLLEIKHQKLSQKREEIMSKFRKLLDLFGSIKKLKQVQFKNSLNDILIKEIDNVILNINLQCKRIIYNNRQNIAIPIKQFQFLQFDKNLKRLYLLDKLFDQQDIITIIDQINLKNIYKRIPLRFIDVSRDILSEFQSLYQQLISFQYLELCQKISINKQIEQLKNKILKLNYYQKICNTFQFINLNNTNYLQRVQKYTSDQIAYIVNECKQIITKKSFKDIQKMQMCLSILIKYENEFPSITLIKQYNNYNQIKKMLKISKQNTKQQTIIHIDKIFQIKQQFKQKQKQIDKEKQCLLSQKIKAINAQIQKNLKNSLKYSNISVQECTIINNSQNTSKQNNQTKQRQKLLEQFKQKKQSLKDNLMKQLADPLKKITNNLIYLKNISITIANGKQKQEIDQILRYYFQKFPNDTFLAEALQRNPSYISNIILIQQPYFSKFNLIIFKNKVKNIGINQVIKELSLSNQTVSILFKKYQSYKRKYDEFINQKNILNFKKNEVIETIKKQMKIRVSKIKQQNQKNLIPELIAYIFILWTVLKADQKLDKFQYLYQPHPAQIIAIFCILGIHTEDKQIKLTNRLAQIKTGEGKSLVLAGLSIYLALIGYEISTVCYSTYLSERDYFNFKNLFEFCEVEKSIKYNTINKLCEEEFSAPELRNNIERILIKKQISNIEFKHNKNKILLIDEVDVFFSNQFYGKLYIPMLDIKDVTVQNLLQFIWKNRNGIDSFKIRQSNEFKQCIKKFPSLSKIIDSVINEIISGVKNYLHDYIVQNDKICYKQHDTISQNINYGYKTIFAYFYEIQRKKIKQDVIKEICSLGLDIAKFSYPQIPMNKFEHIIGVSGTLNVLAPQKIKIIQNQYKLKEKFLIPSVYGKSKFKHKGININKNKDQYYMQIIKKIKIMLQEKRSVIVFFEDKRKLQEFHNSEAFKMYYAFSMTLTQSDQQCIRDARILRASTSGVITLMTKIFGRGTDLIVYENKLMNQGGIHIIQAFLSVQKEEEIQIRGRTARQGNQGSYQLILLQQQFEKIKLNPEQLKHKDYQEMQKTIDKYRNECSKQTYNILSVEINKNKKIHNKSLQLIQNVKQRKIEQVIKYIEDLNNFNILYTNSVKTVIGLDATMSMANILLQVKSVLENAFIQINNILTQEKEKVSFQIQIAVYRNYNCRAQALFQYTPFENNCKRLNQFLNKVTPQGGWQEQALQVFFNHVRLQQNLNQVILIGDAPSNTIAQTKQKRMKSDFGYGEQYWATTRFNSPLDEKQELEQIKKKQIPIHCLYINKWPWPKKYFQNVAKETHGICKQFPMDSTKLKEFIAQRILDKAGGKKLLQAYEKRYKKSRNIQMN